MVPEVYVDDKAGPPTPGSETGVEKAPSAVEDNQPVRINWFRSTLFQAFVTGMASFLAPGCYAALAATGAGGLASVEIGNASVAIAYGLIVPSALVATGFISKLGPRWSLAIGAAGYAPYAAALYTNSAFANQWFLVLGAVICGATSGIFWVTEGTIIMTYSEPEKKGRLLAVWQSLFNLATLIGGGINLGLNIHIDQPGGLSPKTYLVFVALQAIAPLVSLLLSNPKQVQRSDGKPVPPLPGEGIVREFWLTLKELKDPRILACAFLWSQPFFIMSYFSTYCAHFFTVRVRGLTSLVTPILSIIWFQANGVLLDSQRIRLRVKLVVAYGFLTFVMAASTVWLLADSVILGRRDKPVFDWANSGWAAWWIPAVFGQAAAWVAYGYNYYMAGFVFPPEADGVRISRIVATLRSAESGSAAIAFGISSLGLPLWKLGVINLVFVVVIIILGVYVHLWLWARDKEGMFGDTLGRRVE